MRAIATAVRQAQTHLQRRADRELTLLNLFAYTGTVTGYAVAGGARSSTARSRKSNVSAVP